LEILKAANGKDGLNILNKTPTIDLVITDIMMPIMNGYETMEAIRAQKRFKQLPIIALTAKAMKEDREKSIAAGAKKSELSAWNQTSAVFKTSEV